MAVASCTELGGHRFGTGQGTWCHWCKEYTGITFYFHYCVTAVSQMIKSGDKLVFGWRMSCFLRPKVLLCISI